MVMQQRKFVLLGAANYTRAVLEELDENNLLATGDQDQATPPLLADAGTQLVLWPCRVYPDSAAVIPSLSAGHNRCMAKLAGLQKAGLPPRQRACAASVLKKQPGRHDV